MSTHETKLYVAKVALSPRLVRVTYSYDIRVCYQYYPSDACADMQAATQHAEALFPDVYRIFTVSGDVVDTVYTKEDGVWYASKNQTA